MVATDTQLFNTVRLRGTIIRDWLLTIDVVSVFQPLHTRQQPSVSHLNGHLLLHSQSDSV
jgi:hypothetical protein